MGRILSRDGRYQERAYLFVLGAIEYLQCRLDRRRHVTGQELASACRDLALEQYGLTAGLVLAHWGIRSTQDIGRIVFTLVEVNLLSTQPGDTPEDFEGVYDFHHAFEEDYAWTGVPGAG